MDRPAVILVIHFLQLTLCRWWELVVNVFFFFSMSLFHFLHEHPVCADVCAPCVDQ